MRTRTNSISALLTTVQSVEDRESRQVASYIVLPAAGFLMDPDFITLAHTLKCVIVDATSPQRTMAGAGDVEVIAQVFRKATDYKAEFLVADGDRPATIFADYRYRAEPRFLKGLWREYRCGAVLAAQYPIARFQFGRSPEDALNTALDAVEAHLRSAASTNDAVAVRLNAEDDASEFASIRNRDFALALAKHTNRC